MGQVVWGREVRGLFGLSIVQVEPGTVIENEHGHKLTVTDDSAVHKGGAVYLTSKNYEALKTHTREQSEPTT